jgi:hypothetical protein
VIVLVLVLAFGLVLELVLVPLLTTSTSTIDSASASTSATFQHVFPRMCESMYGIHVFVLIISREGRGGFRIAQKVLDHALLIRSSELPAMRGPTRQQIPSYKAVSKTCFSRDPNQVAAVTSTVHVPTPTCDLWNIIDPTCAIVSVLCCSCLLRRTQIKI